MIEKCEWYKYKRSPYNNTIFAEKCNLMQELCTCGGDTHNCDYPVALAMENKSDAADSRADVEREEG